MPRLGVRFEVVLNHVSGARSGVAGIYQRHDRADEKRAALEARADHNTTIIANAQQAGKIVPIAIAPKMAG